jgi:hypothetical protein
MELNREIARAVHTQITEKPETHNQFIWLGGGTSVDSCGTVGCVAGWAAMLDPRNELRPQPFVSWDGDAVLYNAVIRSKETGRELDVPEAGEDALGFDNGSVEDAEAVNWLFAGNRSRDEILAQLDHMADTGEFNWGLVKVRWDSDERRDWAEARR